MKCYFAFAVCLMEQETKWFVANSPLAPQRCSWRLPSASGTTRRRWMPLSGLSVSWRKFLPIDQWLDIDSMVVQIGALLYNMMKICVCVYGTLSVCLFFRRFCHDVKNMFPVHGCSIYDRTLVKWVTTLCFNNSRYFVLFSLAVIVFAACWRDDLPKTFEFFWYCLGNAKLQMMWFTCTFD